MAEYEAKYKMSFEKGCNCIIMNDPKFEGPVTFNTGKDKGLPRNKEEVKAAIEQLFSEGKVTMDVQWFAIKRVLNDVALVPKKKEDFISYIDTLKLDVAIPYNHDNARKGGQHSPRLNADVTAWADLKTPSEAESNQISVALRLIELLKQE